jgi:hypothetical protein
MVVCVWKFVHGCVMFNADYRRSNFKVVDGGRSEPEPPAA